MSGDKAALMLVDRLADVLILRSGIVVEVQKNITVINLKGGWKGHVSCLISFNSVTYFYEGYGGVLWKLESDTSLSPKQIERASTLQPHLNRIMQSNPQAFNLSMIGDGHDFGIGRFELCSAGPNLFTEKAGGRFKTFELNAALPSEILTNFQDPNAGKWDFAYEIEE